MKKLLSLLLCLVFVVGTVPAIYAASAPTLSVEFTPGQELDGDKGEEFTVDITIDKIPDSLFSYDLHIEYDPEVLSFVDITPGITTGIAGEASVSKENDKETGKVRYFYSRVDKKFNSTLATLKFKILDEKETTIKISKDTVLAMESGESSVSLNKLDYYAENLTFTPFQTPKAPDILPNRATIYTTTEYTIRADDDSTIYYTLNGRDPTDKNYRIEYKDSFRISSSTLIRAVAYRNGMYSKIVDLEVKYIRNTGGGGGGSSNPGGGNGTYYPTITPTPAPTATPVPEKYADIVGHWAYSYMKDLIDKGIINGYEDGSVRPNGLLTRQEATKIISSAIGQTAASEVNLSFSDTNEIADWAKGWVQTAVDSKIITGYEDNTFKPTQNVSRKELAVMAMKAFGYGEMTDGDLAFNDQGDIPGWAVGYIKQAVSQSIITGYEDNTFKPNNFVTRAEICAIVSKCLSK